MWNIGMKTADAPEHLLRSQIIFTRLFEHVYGWKWLSFPIGSLGTLRLGGTLQISVPYHGFEILRIRK